VIDFLVVVGMLMLLAGAGVLLRNAVRRRKAVGALAAEDRAHYDALKAARKELKGAQRTHAAKVREAEREVKKARTAEQLGSVGGHVLYDDRIQTPDGTHPLTAEVSATVDTAGALATKSRSTLTRMAAGGVVLGPLGMLIGATAKKSSTLDKRELYLLVDGGEWASMAKLNPDHGEKARQFAQALNVAARKVETVTRERAELVEQLERKLHGIRGDRQQIEAATATVARLEQTAPPPVAALMLKTSGDDSVPAPA
jgi:hypothetical protein